MAWNDAPDWTLSVTDLNEYVRRSLSADPMLRSVKLRGEISGLKRHSSGHMYFTLKDENARIDVAMFRDKVMNLDFRPADGQQVIAEGSVSLYTAAGKYQFYAERLRPDGQGDLFARFERLKERLMREGLFDQSLKKPIPMCARNVGIVTSPTGAVVHDIQTVAARRDPTVRLTLCPVNVQGGAAAGEIARAIARMDRLDFDVLIVGRGGGSIEDLWAFNEEVVARAIFACKTPVISAVGHEVDFTIADFVSDVRAATPSVAAELAIADRGEIERMLDMRLSQLNRALGSMLDRYDARIERAKSRLETLGPRGRLDVCAARLDALEHRLGLLSDTLLKHYEARVQSAESALIRFNPAPQIDVKAKHVAELAARLNAAALRGMSAREIKIDALEGRLRALNPDNVLQRGYAIVTVGGAPVSNAHDVQPGNMLGVRMRGGTVNALTVDISDERGG